MPDIQKLITNNLDIWTGAIKNKKSVGRGSSKKIELTGIKKLRELILELAVRGKLVAQDSNDEPASVLLEKIAVEKERLVKEGKIKKQKPLAEISEDEKPFELPVGWEWKNLSDLFAIVTDGDHQAPPKSDVGYPFLVIGNLNTGDILFENCRYVPKEYYKKLDWSKKPIQNDLLYTVTGSYGIPITVDTIKEFCVQRHVAILKSTSSNPVKYLSLLLKTKYTYDYATSIATGIAQKTVPLTGLCKIPISIPPEKEQHRIVKKVDNLMSLCDKLKTQLINKKSTQQNLATAFVEQTLTTQS